MLCYYKGVLYLLGKKLRVHQARAKCKIRVFVREYVYVKYGTCPCMNVSLYLHACHKRWVSCVMHPSIMCVMEFLGDWDQAILILAVTKRCAWYSISIALVAWVFWSLLSVYTSREKDVSVLSSRAYPIESHKFLLPSATDWEKLALATGEIWPAAAKFSDWQLTVWVGRGDWSGWLSILHLPEASIFPESIRENILLVGIRRTQHPRMWHVASQTMCLPKPRLTLPAFVGTKTQGRAQSGLSNSFVKERSIHLKEQNEVTWDDQTDRAIYQWSETSRTKEGLPTFSSWDSSNFRHF